MAQKPIMGSECAVQRKAQHMFTHAGRLLAGSGISLALLLAGCASSSTQEGASAQDSQYVKVSSTTGYYLLSSTSPMRDQLGLAGAPTTATSNQLQAGRGGDVIAFRFDERGILAKPPAYIYQAQPESYYMERLKGLSVGRSTFDDVKNLFPGSRLVREHGGALVYLIFRVRNPAERSP